MLLRERLKPLHRGKLPVCEKAPVYVKLAEVVEEHLEEPARVYCVLDSRPRHRLLGDAPCGKLAVMRLQPCLRDGVYARALHDERQRLHRGGGVELEVRQVQAARPQRSGGRENRREKDGTSNGIFHSHIQTASFDLSCTLRPATTASWSFGPSSYGSSAPTTSHADGFVSPTFAK